MWRPSGDDDGWNSLIRVVFLRIQRPSARTTQMSQGASLSPCWTLNAILPAGRLVLGAELAMPLPAASATVDRTAIGAAVALILKTQALPLPSGDVTARAPSRGSPRHNPAAAARVRVGGFRRGVPG